MKFMKLAKASVINLILNDHSFVKSSIDNIAHFLSSAKQQAADDNPIEDQMDLLCEELEITKDLLDDLKKSKLVEDNIKEQIDKQGSRAKKIKFLLKKLAVHGLTG